MIIPRGICYYLIHDHYYQNQCISYSCWAQHLLLPSTTYINNIADFMKMVISSNIKWTNYKGLMCHTSYNIFCSLPFNSLTMDVIYTCQIGLAQILLFEAHIEKQLTYPNSERKITPPCNLFHLVCRCYFPFPIM